MNTSCWEPGALYESDRNIDEPGPKFIDRVFLKSWLILEGLTFLMPSVFYVAKRTHSVGLDMAQKFKLVHMYIHKHYFTNRVLTRRWNAPKK